MRSSQPPSPWSYAAGLAAGLYVSDAHHPPTGTTRLTEWLVQRGDTLGRTWASELGAVIHWQAAAGSVSSVVFRRLSGFPPDAGMPVSLFEEAPSSDGFSFVSTLPPGPELDAAVAAEIESLQRRASQLGKLADELRELVIRYDPVELIPSIALPAAMSFGDPTLGDDATQVFSVPAKIEYLVGLALTGPPGTGQVPGEVTQKVRSLIASVFDAAHAHFCYQVVSDRGSGDSGVDQMSVLLRGEHLFDRMAGYDTHLEEIGDAVFEPYRELYYEELGFCPSDAIRLVRRHRRWNNEAFNTTFQEAVEMMDSEDRDEAKAYDSVWRCVTSMDAIYKWTPEILSRSTGLPAKQVGAMLRHMSADFGCQPDFRLPFDENIARRYPLVRLPSGEYLAADPWAVAHGVHEWLQDYVQTNPASRLATKYSKHRSDAAERLVRTSLQTVFGQQRVLSNQHYDSREGPGEIDSLVTGFIPIIVEVKSRTLTEQGRRGYRRRVKTVAQDVVSKSFQQTGRVRNYILKENGRCFANRQGGPMTRRLDDDVSDPVEIVVTLERMDPLATAADEFAGGDQSRNIWITNLADFLMVRDILGDPASFLHYAQTRGRASALGIQIYTESDALGQYLHERLAPLISRATETEGRNAVVMLGYSGTEINQFFTMREMGADPDKPGTGVPHVLRDALMNCASGGDRSWALIATAVMATPPEKWKSWRRFVRRHKGEHPFVLPCGTAAIVASDSLSSTELRGGARPVLAIPRQEARRPKAQNRTTSRHTGL